VGEKGKLRSGFEVLTHISNRIMKFNHCRQFKWLSALLIILAIGCKAPVHNKAFARFDWFEYQGKDSVFSAFEPGAGEFQNPILPGFYPDPSICRVDSDYYLVNSSFSYYPGIPIFHSRDLVHWEQLGYVLNRPSQLNLDTLQLSQGVFAPAISYHNGTFYVINTLVNGGGNFYVTARDPRGPWSDPVWLKSIDGIDPSFFFDTDGKAYIVNNGPPADTPLYSGHRAIWLQEYSFDSTKLTGPRVVIVNGGVDITKNPVWIEGPHLFKKQEYYYLIAAEGGTSTEHSEVVFRSRSVFGPYVPCYQNPILTQRHLSADRKNSVTCTGHADFVETPQGDWWAVFLGCRPYSGDFYNTGRETFMMPVSWQDGWPFITDQEIPYKVKKPALTNAPVSRPALSGNFTWHEDFSDTTLALEWNFIRTPRTRWYSLSSDTGFLKMELQPVSIGEIKNPSFIGRRQQHAFFSATTAMQPVGFDKEKSAGLMAFQNEKHYLYLGITRDDAGYLVFVERCGSDANKGIPQVIASVKLSDEEIPVIYLKIEGRGGKYDFYYAFETNRWVCLKSGVDATNLSTHTGGGFVGAYLGLYGTSKR
jgi:xylan 1,4-beta-xylosidase